MVNDLQLEGGAEVQHWREYNLLRSKGHDVYSLTFDENYPASRGPKYNIPIRQNNVQKLFTRALPIGPKKEVECVLNEVRPDVIHLNNVVKSPLAIYEAVADYPCVQTIRDYGAICPKSTCIHGDYSVCKGYQLESCSTCGKTCIQEMKRRLMPQIENARRSAVDLFIAPSKALADACTANGLETRCLNNPFDFSKLPGRSFDFAQKGFLYYGVISENKGVGRLIEAFSRFSRRHSDATLTLVGKVDSKFEPVLQNALADNGRIEYLGVLPNDKMLTVLASAYCVVVPSLWIENYPNTVLESLATGVLVIGSNRGGIPELIQNETFLFDVTDTASIVDCMERAYGLPGDRYREIVSTGARCVHENNSMDIFYGRLLDVFETAQIVAKTNRRDSENQ